MKNVVYYAQVYLLLPQGIKRTGLLLFRILFVFEITKSHLISLVELCVTFVTFDIPSGHLSYLI